MRRRGVTLIEVLVGATLFLLVTALTFGYLIPATKAANRARVKSHLQQTATVVLAQIKEASTTTSPAGFSWSMTEVPAVAFNAVESLQSSNGILRWSPVYELFWWDSTSETVWTAEFEATLPEEATVLRAKRMTPDRLREVVAASTLNRAMAKGVTAFTVSHGGDEGALIQPVTVTLTIQEPGFSDSPVVDRSLTFRMVNQQ